MTVALGRTHRPVLDEEACGACGVCRGACPAEVLGVPPGEAESLRAALYRDGSGPAPAAEAPCRAACPLGQDAPRYLGELAAGRWLDAVRTIRRTNALPSVCGYLCHRPCEPACVRGRLDAPLSIRELKREAARYERAHPYEVRAILAGWRRPPNGRRVAVVGAGPAGLAAAAEFALAGCGVTLLEAEEAAGGMLRQAIPAFRLPREALDHDLEVLVESLGLDLRPGKRVTSPAEVDALLRSGFDAVLLTLGAGRGRPLPVPGWGGDRCLEALALLRRVNRGAAPELAGQVLVVGGGNVALDAARAAIRAAADGVTVVYRRREGDMPADPEEVREAWREGVSFRFQALPREVAREGDRLVLRGVATRPEPAPRGQKRTAFSVVPGSAWSLDAEWIVAATGQVPEHLYEDGAEGGTGLAVTDGFRVPGHSGVFAAGDGVTGPGYVTEAMASGRAAARQILGSLEVDGETE